MKLYILYSILKYICIVSDILDKLEKKNKSFDLHNPNVFIVMVFGFVLVTSFYSLMTYAHISNFLYHHVLKKLYKNSIIISSPYMFDREEAAEIFERIEWINDNCKKTPFVVTSIRGDDEDLILVFRNEEDLLGYKIMWPEDIE